jgi:RNA-directed DNA polymerase
MLRSRANVELSVRRVTQINKGHLTPGVDNQVATTPEQRTELIEELTSYRVWTAKPAKRVYIPKSDGRQRPLGIPTILDRCMQAIVKNALEPEWEARFEPLSYGFRPGRDCHDAIGRIFRIVLPQGKKHWIVDADIKGAFDNIQHGALLKAIEGFPAQQLVKQWLKAGVMDKGQFAETDLGTPQGGVISPLLANIALHGMEKAVGVTYRNKGDFTAITSRRALVRYADDFVIFAETREDAEAAQADIANWLLDRGLELSKDKTRICHIREGFNFLGFNIRHHPTRYTGYKLLITPSKESVKRFKTRMKQEWSALIGHNVDFVIEKLNPILNGWGNYFRGVVSSKTFQELDGWIHHKSYKWCMRTHPQKTWSWINRRYYGKFRKDRSDRWVFGNVETKAHVMRLTWKNIVRRPLVKHGASPDNPGERLYWEKRNYRKVKLPLNKDRRKIASRQKGKCPICQDWLHDMEDMHIHHIIPKSKEGKDTLDNLALIHKTCHQQIHRRKGEVKQLA